ncbi:hypothetical protein [Pseudogracilibacillus auburnensis]|uniref:hypothetical protein n=1 Tax=Pseudogracilibacillus auburnensis TaxID=1494959 RepID=UPI001A959552|nr:hypothetical protein [Pseudogracilibacillus auburnensis]MBO1005586.1 hypothetical protein [Pseudogracilibacillus auburnensis]
MFSVDQYIRSIQSHLKLQSDVLVGNIKKILELQFSTDIDLLDFCVLIEPTRFELSITMFSMDKSANEVFTERNDTAFAGSVEVLPEIEYYQLNNHQLDDFFYFYEQNEATINPLEEKAFTDWFHQCWKNAGGNALKLPAYLIFHDHYRSFDLKNNQWIEDEIKWS